MRTISSFSCRQRRAPKSQPIEAWAASVVANPAAHHATEAEAAIVGRLLAQMVSAR